MNRPIKTKNKGGAITRCSACRKLLIYGQTCVCGNNDARKAGGVPA